MTHLAIVFAVFLNGLFAGTFFGSSLVEHAARKLNADSWIAYKQAKENVFGAVMPGFLLITLLSSLAAAVVSPNHLAFSAVVVLIGGVTVITVVVHLPINKLIQASAPAAVLDNWAEMRRRWRLWNWHRCGLAIIAFGIALTGSY